MCNLKVLLQFFTLVFSFSSGFAIKCYNCESTLHPDCSDISSSTKLQAEVCTPSLVAVQSANWLKELIKIDFYQPANQQPAEVGMVCQKIVGKRADGNLTTVRSCQLDGAATDPCDVAKAKLKESMYHKAEIVSCDICSKDMCNEASPLRQISNLLMLMLFGLLILSV